MGEASGGITIYNISAQVRGWNCMVFSTLRKYYYWANFFYKQNITAKIVQAIEYNLPEALHQSGCVEGLETNE